ncbi:MULTISPECIES: four-carbon acid sugar kinase family protein [Cylindrospermopsis]|uniref:four-carbon acid sugar kinase family protein n=1 Tax=Cylindrospermopsis TaxID=77021 RepID=UPI00070EF0E7|nr:MULTISPECIES: four-carbon acid sugar kinase family protein [Cylindrospermopsis]MBU6345269.1 four-carbon acid sugar kinase family protein [Cyanobacteria bacterium REEB494]KRH95551.1 Hrp-dependent type III effector protein [Cylindrospermopsis sp. CR12]TPX26983.1 four-carbon acid sugar kinase family protein [Cylindrospermopsis raciborskii GIHE 2018]UJL33400.1 four-carbon acid sugar kinase family protein [Cylindrospermopsis raciborskii Cr2010]UJS03342.1 four-carbon acid sugar kinase family prot
MNKRLKIIVLDDDPTGSQTVHSCLLLMQWDVETLRLGLQDHAPIFFVLTNTRSLTPEAADKTTREVCHNLKIALAEENVADFLVVSRSDSTLRGHYPIETDVIAEELGPFDAHFLIPAFFEGGRITRDAIHYLIVDGIPTPVHETEFARDSVFGYNYSYLPKYVEEKTQGRIPESAVTKFTLEDMRQGSLSRLLTLHNNQCGVVDGETQEDLNMFARDILTAATQGKRFLFRSAASILTALANLPPQPIAPENMARYVRGGKPGAVIVGSHVKKTTQQLESLLKIPQTVGIEVNVAKLLYESVNESGELLKEILEQVEQVHHADKIPVVFTSRQELTFPDVKTRLDFGLRVSALLMDIVRGLPRDIGFLISKGGITSNDVLSTGLALTSARLLGQILPGCSMVITPSDHPHFPNLPLVLFPGNVGNVDGLATICQRLTITNPAK